MPITGLCWSFQPLHGVGADQLVNVEAGAAAGFGKPLDQRQLGKMCKGRQVGSGDRARSRRGEATDEDPQRCQHRSLRLESTTATSCRARLECFGVVRRHAVRRLRASWLPRTDGSAARLGESTRIQFAASSMANGKPLSIRQMSATMCAFNSVIRYGGATVLALSMNKAVASFTKGSD